MSCQHQAKELDKVQQHSSSYTPKAIENNVNPMNQTNITTTTLKTIQPFPFYNEVIIALLFLTIYVFEQFFGKLLKTSPLLGHLLAGIILGPACLNLVPFPQAFRFFGKVGVMLLVVESGLATDMKRVVKFGTRAFFAALSGTISPVILAVAGGILFFSAEVRVGLAAGSAIAPTSLGFSAKLLGTKGLQSNLGSIIAISAVIDDVLSLCLLEIVRALATAKTTWDYLRPVVASFGSIVGGLFVVLCIKKINFIDRFVQFIVSCNSNKKKDIGINEQPKDRVFLLLILFITIILGWSCASVGSSDLLGCFLAGLTFSDSNETKKSFKKHFSKLTKIGTSLFFACTVGFGVPSIINGSGLFNSQSILIGVMLFFAALVGKAFPLGLFAKPLTILSFLKFSIAMQGRGEFSFLIAETGKTEGVLDQYWHGGCILAVFLASFLAPFGFRCILNIEGGGKMGFDGDVVKEEIKMVEMDEINASISI